jgi:dipeptidyl aminopeptidase/acylaminoacyl peptidase
VSYRYSDAKAGTVIDQAPPTGTKLAPGDAVTVVVARPLPPLALTAAGKVVLLDLATGKTHPAVKGKLVAEQPALSPDGSLIAFRRGPHAFTGQIWSVKAGNPATAHPVTNAGFDDRRPAISPDGRTIAFVRGPKEGDTHAGTADLDLCFARTSAYAKPPSCIKDPATVVDRPAWAPDGKAILVVSRQLPPGGVVPTTDAWKYQQWNLGEYVTDAPGSRAPSQWRSLGVVTAKLHGKKPEDTVFQAAWSPSGTQVGFVANWGATDVARVFLAPVKNDRLGKAKPQDALPACQLAWRPDGGELVLVQADASCTSVAAQGHVVRVDPAQPTKPTTLTGAGFSDPAWPGAPPAK